LTEITIPESVISIGPSAFYGCEGLTSITIPESVISIGVCAFFGCVNLKSVSIPKSSSLTFIGKNAFFYCKGLTSITIPESVTSIGNLAFSYCINLTTITIPESVTSIGDNAFGGCDALKGNCIDGVCYLGNEQNPYRVLLKSEFKNITQCSVNARTVLMVNAAFSGCVELKAVTIPEYSFLSSISSNAFSGCAELTSISIPESVISIGECAFSGCVKLTAVTIPEFVSSVGDRCFEGCSSLSSVLYLGISDPGKSSYGVFADCPLKVVNVLQNYFDTVFCGVEIRKKESEISSETSSEVSSEVSYEISGTESVSHPWQWLFTLSFGTILLFVL